MNMIRLYQNFAVRNLTLIVLFILVIFGCVYNNAATANESLFIFIKIIRGFFPLYLAMIFSNTIFVKKLFFQKKYVLFALLFLSFWSCYCIGIEYYYDYMNIDNPTTVSLDLGKVSLLLSVIAIANGTAFYFLHLWILRSIAESQKEKMNIESELSFLKQQLNPHFLLNAMNNLYGESLAEPERVPERILNLSDLLRYQIEATKKDLVPLQEEIEFVAKYIEYSTFRNERLIVKQKYSGRTERIAIPPLFFLPLVENAIKFSEEMTEPFINLDFEIKGRDLSFSIQNNFLVCGSRAKGTGIGIENLKRRLEVDGIRHKLHYENKGKVFNIKLDLWDLPTVA
jgi:hypothetical protein